MICRHCQSAFTRYHPDQVLCAAPACRKLYALHKAKIRNDKKTPRVRRGQIEPWMLESWDSPYYVRLRERLTANGLKTRNYLRT